MIDSSSRTQAALPDISHFDACQPSVAALFSPAFYQAYQLLNEWYAHLCWHTMQSHHLMTSLPLTQAAIQEKLGVCREAHYLLENVLAILVEEGILQKRDHLYHGPLQPEPPSSPLMELFPDDPLFQMMARCQAQWFEVLQGAVKGFEVIFPYGDTSLWCDIHRHSLIMSPYARLASLVVNHYRQAGASILELGAGCGAATTLVVDDESYPPIGEYTFTDVSLAFLRQAQKRFGKRPFMAYQRYDLDKPASGQRLEPERYDIIFAVNVLHVVQDIPATLRQLRPLLKPGGHLILGEGSPPTPDKVWRPNLLFGYLEGWWRVPTHPTYRPQPGFLPPATWQELLSAAGFNPVSVLPPVDYHPSGACYGGVIVGNT